MKRALVISYFYPPLAGVGIIKVFGTTRYLPEFGWEPTVLCALPDGNYITDSTNAVSVPPRIFVRRPPFAPLLIRVLGKLRMGDRNGLLLPDNYVDWFLPA